MTTTKQTLADVQEAKVDTVKQITDLALKMETEFARKTDMSAMGNRLNELKDTVNKQSDVLVLVAFRLEAIQTVLVRILWAIATPVLAGVGFSVYYWVSDMIARNAGM